MKRVMILAISAAVLALLLPATASARSPRAVDPASLTPALNPNFTWSCFDTGAGPICQGTFDVSYENEQIDMVCNGSPVYVTGSGSERMTRWHTPDGRGHKDDREPQLPRRSPDSFADRRRPERYRPGALESALQVPHPR